MKNNPENYTITVTDPESGEDFEFALEDDFNADLTIRLVRKRKHLQKSSRDIFSRLKDIREKYDMDKLNEEIHEASLGIQNFKRKEGETDEEFKERFDKAHKKLTEVRDKYPDEALEAQEKLQDYHDRITSLGIKIAQILLSPKGKIPSRYKSKNDFIHDVVFDDEAHENIVAFFLIHYASFTMSQQEPKPSVKIQKNK